MIYGGYSQTELDAQYNARSTVPDVTPYFQRYDALSEQARERYGSRLNVRYGSHPDETLDLFAAEAPAAPTLLFFHGGFWRSFHKDNFSFVAAGFVPHGIHVAVVNYSLAPAASLDHVLAQCSAATAWIAHHAREFGGSAAAMVATGHSAGGQIAAMLAVADWPAHGLPGDTIARIGTISGLHDLEPVRLSYVNEWLSLDAESARRNSPLSHLPPHPTRLVAAVGADETNEFKRQTRAIAAAYAEHGYPVRALELDERNHFSICLDLADPMSDLTRAIVEGLILT